MRICVWSAFLLCVLASSASAQAKRTKDNFVGCLTKDGYEEIVGYFVQKDNGPAAQMIAGGECIFLKPGLTVYIEDTAIFKGMIKIRLAGSRASVWTAIEAVE
jgi:hypothetical protein